MSSPNDDYNPIEKIEALSANFHQPDKFAENFCKVARTQKSVDEVLKEIFRSQIKNDPEVIASIKAQLREVNKEDWRFFVKKIGATGWAIIWLITGAILTTITGIVVKKFFP